MIISSPSGESTRVFSIQRRILVTAASIVPHCATIAFKIEIALEYFRPSSLRPLQRLMLIAISCVDDAINPTTMMGSIVRSQRHDRNLSLLGQSYPNLGRVVYDVEVAQGIGKQPTQTRLTGSVSLQLCPAILFVHEAEAVAVLHVGMPNHPSCRGKPSHKDDGSGCRGIVQLMQRLTRILP